MNLLFFSSPYPYYSTGARPTARSWKPEERGLEVTSGSATVSKGVGPTKVDIVVAFDTSAARAALAATTGPIAERFNAGCLGAMRWLLWPPPIEGRDRPRLYGRPAAQGRLPPVE